MNAKTPLPEKNTMKTMVECLNSLFKAGFQTQFIAEDCGLRSLATQRLFKPEEVEILNFYRFEGESDPSDSSILYAIETNTGERGTLTDAFGSYSDSRITQFIQQVETINKKVNRDES
jgi:hypothetical protein